MVRLFSLDRWCEVMPCSPAPGRATELVRDAVKRGDDATPRPRPLLRESGSCGDVFRRMLRSATSTTLPNGRPVPFRKGGVGYPRRPAATATSSDVESKMSQRRQHLSFVEPGDQELRERFETLTGRKPTRAELEAFARWRAAVGLRVPLATRRTVARVITRI